MLCRVCYLPNNSLSRVNLIPGHKVQLVVNGYVMSASPSEWNWRIKLFLTRWTRFDVFIGCVCRDQQASTVVAFFNRTFLACLTLLECWEEMCVERFCAISAF